MTVRTNYKNAISYPLTAKDLESGKAYEDDLTNIFVCNPYKDAVAFSLCGNVIIQKSSVRNFREITLDVNVS